MRLPEGNIISGECRIREAVSSKVFLIHSLPTFETLLLVVGPMGKQYMENAEITLGAIVAL